MSAIDSLPGAASGPGDCFHCGLIVPAGARFGFSAAGAYRRFCCAGCEAVSRSISGLGLDDYYRLRAAPAPRPAAEAADLASYDDALVQAAFVRTPCEGEREALLLLQGLRCSACAWLVEQVVGRIPGVIAIELNYATRRARLRWNAAGLRLSAALAAIRDLGYSAWPYEPQRLALIERGERRTLLRRLWVAGLGMMQVMMYAVPAYIAQDGEISTDAASLMRWAGLVLTLPVMMYSAAPFFAGAWRDLRLRAPGMDVPIAIGLAVAFGASVAATLAGDGDVYFDSIAMFVFLLLGARYLEMLARSRAGSALEHLARLVPQTAHRLGEEGSLQTTELPVARLAVGDRVLVRGGEAVPADGELESGRAQVSEAWLSGESRPIRRDAGGMLLGGSVNVGPALVVRVTRVGEDTAISSIHRLMERALGERPEWMRAAELASRAFVVVILAAALAAGLAWLAIDPPRALAIAVAVLVVTCPCALALAAPATLTAAVGALARCNLVVTRAHAIERLAGVSDFVFDKTGTLTHGNLRLLETFALGDRSPADCLALAAALASCSNHPVDRALRAAATNASAQAPGAAVAGEGIEANVEGRRVRLGRARFVSALHGKAPPVEWVRGGDTLAYLGDEAGWIAAFRLGDALREEAGEAVALLRSFGVTVRMLSGDAPAVVRRAAGDLGIEHFAGGATPEDKLAAVRELQASGRRVAMVGDGINDAPVLAQADVSIAMGGGAQVAQARADAVLLSDSPVDLARAVAVARRARRVLRQNLAWALAYNAVAIPLAVIGWVSPLVAAIGMSASSLLVVANAARLRS